MKKVVVGLSGGVDSAVAASLLKNEYEVIGVTLQMQGDCFASKDIEDAQNVAKILGIEHVVLDCQERFEAIKDYFVQSYLAGKTPNPCVVCNPTVKWAALCEYADETGADYVATGHYAYVEKLNNGRYALRAADSRKDQTYALYGLTQEQLRRTIMPLGRFSSKDEVRDIAKSIGLPVSDKPDSMEVCFIPDNDYAGFIADHAAAAGKSPKEGSGTAITAMMPGSFVDEEGKVLGEHKGIIHYTIGQRKGLGIAFGEPMFVKEIRAESNEVVLARNEDLFTSELRAGKINLMGAGELAEGMRCKAKIRYAHKGEMCEISECCKSPDHEGISLKIRFDDPVRAVTKGQAVVLYDETGYVICGGIIE